MTKKELLKDKLSGDWVKITFESNEEATEAKLVLRSTCPMNKSDLLLALIDWINDFVIEGAEH